MALTPQRLKDLETALAVQPITTAAGAKLLPSDTVAGALIVTQVDSSGNPVVSGGDATAANQVLQLAQETAISGKLPATLGTKAAAASLSVTPSSDGTFIVGGAAADGAAVSGSPVRIGGKDGSGNTQDIITDTTGNMVVVGNVADSAADSGNPVKVGGISLTTTPTLADGQRGNLQLGTRGSLKVELYSPGSASALSTGPDNIDGVTVASTNSRLFVAARGYDFNGTSWDRRVKSNASSRIVSAANSTNSTLAKGSAGNVHMLTGYNSNAALRYLKLYNKATAPTVGTDTPVFTFALPPTAAFAFDFAGGHYFATGIGYGLTTGSADADTGAVTAGDILGLNVAYS